MEQIIKRLKTLSDLMDYILEDYKGNPKAYKKTLREFKQAFHNSLYEIEGDMINKPYYVGYIREKMDEVLIRLNREEKDWEIIDSVGFGAVTLWFIIDFLENFKKEEKNPI